MRPDDRTSWTCEAHGGTYSRRGDCPECKALLNRASESPDFGIELARVLEKVMRDRKHEDTWQDVADLVVMGLANASFVLVPKASYDRVLTSLRNLKAELAKEASYGAFMKKGGQL